MEHDSYTEQLKDELFKAALAADAEDLEDSYDIYVRTARVVRAWGPDQPGTRRFRVDLGTGAVRAWDVVAGHYTTCHDVPESTCRRLRTAAAKAWRLEQLARLARLKDELFKAALYADPL